MFRFQIDFVMTKMFYSKIISVTIWLYKAISMKFAKKILSRNKTNLYDHQIKTADIDCVV